MVHDQSAVTSILVYSKGSVLSSISECGDVQQVQEEQLSAVVDWLTAQPRAAQLLDKDSSVVSTLEYHFAHHLKDVKRHYVKADKR